MLLVRALPVRWLLTGALLTALAVVLGALTPGRSGADASGEYLDFTGPGVGWMEVPNAAELSPAEEVTVEAWIYLRSYTGGFGNDGGLNCPMLVSKNWSQAYSLALACGGDVTEAFINGVNAQGNLTIPLNTWTHVAMSYDGVTLRTYVNGQLDVEVVVNQDIGVTTDPLQIGHDVQWDRTPDGSIDDVRIWRVARTQSQIESGMGGVPANSFGLAARWTFDGGSLGDLVSGRTGNLVGDVEVATPTPTPSPSPTPTPSGGTPTPTPSPLPTGSPVPAGSKGDVDCDGRIGLSDVFLFLVGLAGFSEVDEQCVSQPAYARMPPRLNLNCDGLIDTLDVLLLLLHVARVELPMPTGCGAIGGPPDPTPTSTPVPTPTVIVD